MSSTLSAFLRDEDLPTEFVDDFFGKLHRYCVAEQSPATINTFWLLATMEPIPLVRKVIQQWRDEGLYARLEALSAEHHESLNALLVTDPGLRSMVRIEHSMYLPPSMAGESAPIIIGRQEQEQEAKAAEQRDRGLDAQNRGDFVAARDLYESAVQLNSRDRELAFDHAQIYLHLGDPQRSAQLLGELCTAVPRSARFQSALGSALASAGRPEEALAALDRALDLDPGRTTAVVNKATILNQLGRHAEAADLLLAEFAGEAPLQPSPEIAAGLCLTMMKSIAAVAVSPNPEPAEQLSVHLCRLNPHDPIVWELRAHAAARLGHPDDALSYYRAALELDPNRPSTARACLSLAKTGARRDTVVVVVRRYLTVVPHDGHVWNDLGTLLAELDDVSGAIECFRQAVHHEPNDAMHWMNLGAILLQANCGDESMREGLSYLDRAIQLQPDHLPTRFNRAGGLYMLGEFSRAADEFAKLMRVDPNFPQAADLLSACRQALAGEAGLG